MDEIGKERKKGEMCRGLKVSGVSGCEVGFQVVF